ncbi:glycosyltransferase family 2 protein [Paenibacillus koleovorans]|uniref:glycosyltransferase family 2 protein n=1 Tax=Paenibacillus koleovorans TaxID=121608 RepID=UPI000FDC2785|nr:glycosyltransferase family 2 protein [Paenibacillus koleovorans]
MSGRQQASFPLVTIVTPSYQQAGYIRETIESIWSQNYPNLEHLVIDGGSTDGTVEILKHYARKEPRFRYVSEKDRGQSHALNKGLAMAKGSVIGWLNSDDTYHPQAIARAVKALVEHPEYGAVYGRAMYTDAGNRPLSPYPVDKKIGRARLFDVCTICQPAVFFRKSVLEKTGPIDESLQFCMDYELWMRIAKQAKLGFIDAMLANSRLHEEAKTVKQYFSIGLPECIRSSIKNFGAVSSHWVMQFLAHHLHEGPGWLIERLKAMHVFGPTAGIRQSARYEDGWVPPRWRLELEGKPSRPVDFLLIQGENNLHRLHGSVGKMHCTVTVDNRTVKKLELDKGRFNVKIPLPVSSAAGHIEIRSHASLNPKRLQLSDDNRELSLLVKRAIPLSKAEAALYELLEHDPASIGEWLMQHPALQFRE